MQLDRRTFLGAVGATTAAAVAAPADLRRGGTDGSAGRWPRTSKVPWGLAFLPERRRAGDRAGHRPRCTACAPVAAVASSAPSPASTPAPSRARAACSAAPCRRRSHDEPARVLLPDQRVRQPRHPDDVRRRGAVGADPRSSTGITRGNVDPQRRRARVRADGPPASSAPATPGWTRSGQTRRTAARPRTPRLAGREDPAAQRGRRPCRRTTRSATRCGPTATATSQGFDWDDRRPDVGDRVRRERPGRAQPDRRRAPTTAGRCVEGGDGDPATSATRSSPGTRRTPARPAASPSRRTAPGSGRWPARASTPSGSPARDVARKERHFHGPVRPDPHGAPGPRRLAVDHHQQPGRPRLPRPPPTTGSSASRSEGHPDTAPGGDACSSQSPGD